ncbi:DUF481 domain-containing protein [Negadavirga shengliensis]|uniref:DUF481 domain-containing protein n=1 Tax=Negadavirga shengliensis TaxID=1389218 RepID=A0ABV9T2K0_9BACT
MKRSYLTFCLLLVNTFCLLGQDKDTVYLFNQSPLIGEIKRIKHGTMFFKGDDLGNIEIDLLNIKTLRAYGYGYRIQTAEREFVVGVFRPHDDDGKVIVYDGYEERTLLIRNLNDVQLIHKSFFKRLEGRAGAGYSYTRSSNIGRWNGDLLLEYDTERLDIDLRGSIIITQAEGTWDREREGLQLISNYYFSPNWFGFGMANYQRNLQLGINRRLQQGLGTGIPFLQHKRGVGTLTSGLVINQEINTEGIRNHNLFEVPVILNIAFFKLKSPKISFSTSQTLFIGLIQSGRYRNDGETRINWKIINNIDLGINFYNNFDNRPPLEIRNTNFDYGLVFNLGYTF